MASNNPGIFKKGDEGFLKFLWHSEKKEFLGRTGTSWAKIGVFYLIFYSCLAAFWAAMLAVFFQTLDTENRPTYTPGPGGSLLRNPALGFRPGPRKENIESTLVWYKMSHENDILHWTESLDEFIKDYEGTNDDGQHVKDCDFEQYEKEKEEEMKAGKRRDNSKACKFQDIWLRGNCNKADKWGYNKDSPCIILKINKMIDWEPDVYKSIEELPTEMPGALKETIRNMTKSNNGKMHPMVWVSCEGENPADKEYLPKVEMSPYSGFPAYYFPYTKIPGYRSPLIGVMIHKPEPNVLINIECRLWAKNIAIDRGNRLGMVHFELLRD